MIQDITNNICGLKENIAEAAKTCDRNPDDITLIAVSKKKSIHDIKQALIAGQTHFGESYVQELASKVQDFNNPAIIWHFIGHLQKNKAKFLVGYVDLIHTIDRISLAQTINQLAENKNIVQKGLIQVKISQEESKYGILPEEVPTLLTELNSMNNINIMGLMLIGTWTEDTTIQQKEFHALRKLRDDLNAKNLYRNELKELSMGMSHDYALAIKEGATMIRIGTDIFGERV
ncbi:MAG: YggS family pyridoxal phosphate-dependent enzyme [bacterium]|nr:YggS family pyridoxal phosphate-dependent enzyme [bacterium]MBU1917866.1 YggS family pyridoxal phosphate-dependent enzyme [bacterium]